MATQTNTVGQSLKALRQLAGLTQLQVADRADSANSYLSKVESGAFVPAKDYIARITSVITDELKRQSTAA